MIFEKSNTAVRVIANTSGHHFKIGQIVFSSEAHSNALFKDDPNSKNSKLWWYLEEKDFELIKHPTNLLLKNRSVTIRSAIERAFKESGMSAISCGEKPDDDLPYLERLQKFVVLAEKKVTEIIKTAIH